MLKKNPYRWALNTIKNRKSASKKLSYLFLIIFQYSKCTYLSYAIKYEVVAISEINYNYIEKLFKEGKTIKNISNLINVDSRKISKILQSIGYTTSNKRIISDINEINNIISEYEENGMSIVDIAKKHNVGDKQISKILKDNDVEIFNKGKFTKKYFADESYFENINNEYKAYFLGLLSADGNITSNDKIKRVSITLKKEDCYILEEMKNQIKYTGDIKYYMDKTYNSEYGIFQYFSSGKLYNNLIELGILPNKTFIFDFSYTYNKIPDNLKHHFIRGYFDGDGSITISKIKSNGKNRLTFKFKITGTHDTCNYISKILNIDTKIYTYKRCVDTCDLETSKKEKIVEIYDIMYNDANIFFKRKKDRFDMFFIEKNIVKNK